MDIYGDTYDRVFIDGNVPSEIFNDANILQLSRNTSDGAYTSDGTYTSNEAYESEYETSQDEDSSEYIFSDSADRYLTEAEVRDLSLQELNYARNEIYARRGRKFDSAELQNYFNSKSWYDPRIEAEDFSEDCFNDYELENLELLVKMENSLKGSGQDTPQTGNSSDYIIADSASKYLTEAEVRALNLSKQELNYAKNEIYARKGRKFNSSELQNYFNSKSWYNPRIEPEDFSDDFLNDYEIENAALLAEMERS